MKILDLFSGIGGFSLGLHRASKEFKTVAFCEQDPFCTQILNKHWPDVPVYPDIRKLNGKEIGTVQIVCGGFPCQPYSQAGKRRGKDDDRDLWPEMFRIIQELQPHARWIAAENVAGFVNMELDRTVADLESENYEVRVFILGAVSVQAPHQRQRCWIIGRKKNLSDPERNGLATSEVEGGIAETVRKKPQGQNNSLDSKGTSGLPGTGQDVADSEIEGRERRGTGRSGVNTQCEKTVSGRGGARDVADSEIIGTQGSGTIGEQESPVSARQEISGCNGTGSGGSHRSTQRGMGHLADGLSAELLDIGSIWHIEPDIPRVTTGEKNRVKKLKALGNSVVPQIPEIIGRLIMEVEREIQ